MTGNFIKELLDTAGVPQQRADRRAHAHISQVVHEGSTGKEYRFVPQGYLTEPEWRAALDALGEVAGGWLVLSGSLRGVPEDFFAQAARAAQTTQGQRVVLDTSGAALRAALAAGEVDVVKPSLGSSRACSAASCPGRRRRRPRWNWRAQAPCASCSAHAQASRRAGHGRTESGACPPRCARARRGQRGDSFVAAMTLALARGEPPNRPSPGAMRRAARR